MDDGGDCEYGLQMSCLSEVVLVRILDVDSDRSLGSIGIYLTPEEASQLVGQLQDLLDHPDNNHAHLNDAEYQHEITVSVYTPSNIRFYDERSKRLILTGR